MRFVNSTFIAEAAVPQNYFKANKTNYKWLKFSKTYKQLREVVVTVTARQRNLPLVNGNNVHETEKGKH